MSELPNIGKTLLVIGLVIAATGFIIMSMGGKIPWIGHLPGDVSVKGKNFTFYFPAATCILVSVILSFIFFFFRGR
ncbi:MAG: DUF2905 domain-containing protein [Deltaproteobacteria bacterium]|nr:DUF2905 domain-containing protein [Deltaproteobacteria bacterium]